MAAITWSTRSSTAPKMDSWRFSRSIAYILGDVFGNSQQAIDQVNTTGSYIHASTRRTFPYPTKQKSEGPINEHKQFSDGRVIRGSLLILLATLLGSVASFTRASPVDRLQDQLLGSRLTVHVPEPMTEMVGIKLEIIASFWETLIGGPSTYARPMPVKHFPLHLREEHFERWLFLWQANGRAQLSDRCRSRNDRVG